MVKAFAAYEAPAFTIGAEVYTQYLQNSLLSKKTVSADTVSGRNLGLSAFVRGKLWKDKLDFFARMDRFNPYVNPVKGSASVTSLLSPYDPANRNGFMTAGLDYSPVKNVHFIPNIWYCRYKELSGRRNKDYDLIYRLTFFYKFEG